MMSYLTFSKRWSQHEQAQEWPQLNTLKNEYIYQLASIYTQFQFNSENIFDNAKFYAKGPRTGRTVPLFAALYFGQYLLFNRNDEGYAQHSREATQWLEQHQNYHIRGVAQNIKFYRNFSFTFHGASIDKPALFILQKFTETNLPTTANSGKLWITERDMSGVLMTMGVDCENIRMTPALPQSISTLSAATTAVTTDSKENMETKDIVPHVETSKVATPDSKNTQANNTTSIVIQILVANPSQSSSTAQQVSTTSTAITPTESTTPIQSVNTAALVVADNKTISTTTHTNTHANNFKIRAGWVPTFIAYLKENRIPSGNTVTNNSADLKVAFQNKK